MYNLILKFGLKAGPLPNFVPGGAFWVVVAGFFLPGGGEELVASGCGGAVAFIGTVDNSDAGVGVDAEVFDAIASV